MQSYNTFNLFSIFFFMGFYNFLIFKNKSKKENKKKSGRTYTIRRRCTLSGQITSKTLLLNNSLKPIRPENHKQIFEETRMADSGAKVKEKRTKKNKKRKQRINEDTERYTKTRRIGFSEGGSEPQGMEEEKEEVAEKSGQRELNQDLEEGCPWRNLQLILSLQKEDLGLQKLVSFSLFFSFLFIEVLFSSVCLERKF